MPHIGRTYPYHPIYWATDATFWPAFCPWKMMFHMPLSSSQPFIDASGPNFWLSTVGVVSSDRKIMTYTWDYTNVVDTWHVEIQILTAIVAGLKQPYLHMDLSSLMSGGATAESTLSNVIEAWPFVGMTGCDPAPGVPPYLPANVFLRPATYAEGGTPYPHPTGGPMP